MHPNKNGASLSIKAVTFDFWNTLYSADGWAPDKIRPLRLAALADALASCGKSATDDELNAAWQAGFERYLETWRGGRQFGARQQVEHVLGLFDCIPGDEVAAETTRRIQDASMAADLVPMAGLHEVLPQLVSKGIGLGIISDTGLTPGRILRRILERDGLAGYFSVASFSDEMGFPKPHPDMFLQTLAPLDAKPFEAAHIGDMPPTDIAGALGVGDVGRALRRGQRSRRAAGGSLRDTPSPRAPAARGRSRGSA